MSEYEFDNVAIIERLKQACGVTSNKALGDLIGAAPNKISSWKTTLSPPYDACFWVSENFPVSMHWLLLGGSDKQKNMSVTQPNEAQFTKAFAQVVRHAEQVQVLTIADDVLDPELRRQGLLLYKMLYQANANTSILLPEKRQKNDKK